jgi:hypothetical protein
MVAAIMRLNSITTIAAKGQMTHRLSRVDHLMSGISSMAPASNYNDIDMRRAPKQIRHKNLRPRNG